MGACGVTAPVVPLNLPPPVFQVPLPPPEGIPPSFRAKHRNKEDVKKKNPAVLQDRDFCGLTAEKMLSNPGYDPEYYSEKFERLKAKPHSYLNALGSGLNEFDEGNPSPGGQQMCPYAAAGTCHYRESCLYLHGDLCEICDLQVLHPFDQVQQKTREKMCMVAFEHDMEKSFAFQVSQDNICSICMKVVYEKAIPNGRRFGMLSNCNQTYCLACVRQWRCAEQFENPIIKSCPECRVVSEFVIPSVHWVEDHTKKDDLIEVFRQGMGKNAFKYFEQGKGTCPFGRKCLYLYAYS